MSRAGAKTRGVEHYRKVLIRRHPFVSCGRNQAKTELRLRAIDQEANARDYLQRASGYSAFVQQTLRIRTTVGRNARKRLRVIKRSNYFLCFVIV